MQAAVSLTPAGGMTCIDRKDHIMKSVFKTVAPIAMTLTFVLSGIAMADTAATAVKGADTTSESAKPAVPHHKPKPKAVEAAKGADAVASTEKTAATKPAPAEKIAPSESTAKSVEPAKVK